jgi:hypothetical protein
LLPIRLVWKRPHRAHAPALRPLPIKRWVVQRSFILGCAADRSATGWTHRSAEHCSAGGELSRSRCWLAMISLVALWPTNALPRAAVALRSGDGVASWSGAVGTRAEQCSALRGRRGHISTFDICHSRCPFGEGRKGETKGHEFHEFARMPGTPRSELCSAFRTSIGRRLWAHGPSNARRSGGGGRGPVRGRPRPLRRDFEPAIAGRGFSKTNGRRITRPSVFQRHGCASGRLEPGGQMAHHKPYARPNP